MLIAVSPVGARLVGRVGPVGLLRRGLAGTFLASLATLVAVFTMAGLWPLLVCLAALMAANGLVLPNGTAGALAGQDTALGAACALLGLGQFGAGAVGAPLVGVGGQP